MAFWRIFFFILFPPSSGIRTNEAHEFPFAPSHYFLSLSLLSIFIIFLGVQITLEAFTKISFTFFSLSAYHFLFTLNDLMTHMNVYDVMGVHENTSLYR